MPRVILRTSSRQSCWRASRREALHAHEGVARHVGHDPQRERHDRLQSDQTKRHRDQAQRHDGAKGRERGAARGRIGCAKVTASTRCPENSGMNRSATVAPSKPPATVAAPTG